MSKLIVTFSIELFSFSFKLITIDFKVSCMFRLFFFMFIQHRVDLAVIEYKFQEIKSVACFTVWGEWTRGRIRQQVKVLEEGPSGNTRIETC